MIRVYIAALAVLTTNAFSQDAPVKTTIVTFALGIPTSGFKAFFKNSEEIQPFNASGHSLGVPVAYQGPRRFVIRESEDAFKSPAEGEKAKPPIAFVDLPERSDNVLILAAVEGDKVRMAAFDVSSSNLGKGDYRVFNFSHSTLSVVLQKQRFALAPGKDVMVKDSSWRGEEPLAFPIEIATVAEGKATRVYSSFWEHWPERRNIIFMFDGTRRNEPIKFMGFDLEPPIKPKVAAE